LRAEGGNGQEKGGCNGWGKFETFAGSKIPATRQQKVLNGGEETKNKKKARAAETAPREPELGEKNHKLFKEKGEPKKQKKTKNRRVTRGGYDKGKRLDPHYTTCSWEERGNPRTKQKALEHSLKKKKNKNGEGGQERKKVRVPWWEKGGKGEECVGSQKENSGKKSSSIGKKKKGGVMEGEGAIMGNSEKGGTGGGGKAKADLCRDESLEGWQSKKVVGKKVRTEEHEEPSEKRGSPHWKKKNQTVAKR